MNKIIINHTAKKVLIVTTIIILVVIILLLVKIRNTNTKLERLKSGVPSENTTINPLSNPLQGENYPLNSDDKGTSVEKDLRNSNLQINTNEYFPQTSTNQLPTNNTSINTQNPTSEPVVVDNTLQKPSYSDIKNLELEQAIEFILKREYDSVTLDKHFDFTIPERDELRKLSENYKLYNPGFDNNYFYNTNSEKMLILAIDFWESWISHKYNKDYKL